MFAVRSVDGQLGIVAARHKVHAVERLDEFANFEGCPIRELPESMHLLDISDEGNLTLAQLGEDMDAAGRVTTERVRATGRAAGPYCWP